MRVSMLTTREQIVKQPTEEKPWSNCVVYIVSKPPSQEGVINDFYPREEVTVRIRVRKTERKRMLVFAQPLRQGIQDAATSALKSADLSVVTYTNPLAYECESWLSEGCHWVYPRQLQGLMPPTSSQSNSATVLDPELDSYPIMDFSYDCKGFFGSPRGFFGEWDLITS